MWKLGFHGLCNSFSEGLAGDDLSFFRDCDFVLFYLGWRIDWISFLIQNRCLFYFLKFRVIHCVLNDSNKIQSFSI